MKRLFSLFVMTLVAAASINTSAQSLVGKWETSGDAQAERLKTMNGNINESISTMSFSDNGTYIKYVYIDATADANGVEMNMVVEIIEAGSWGVKGSELTLTAKLVDVSKYDISYSKPELNEMVKDMKSQLQQTMEYAIGQPIIFNIEFSGNDKVNLKSQNKYLPKEYTLTRTKQ